MEEKFDFNRAAEAFLAGNYKKKPVQRRKPVLKKRVKSQSNVEQESLRKLVERKAFITKLNKERRKLSNETENQYRQVLINRAINPTLRVAIRKKMSSADIKVLKSALYQLLKTHGNLPLKRFDRLCTQKRKEVMSLGLRIKLEKQLGISHLRMKLSKMKDNVGTLEELETESVFEEYKNTAGYLPRYRPLKKICRLVSRESGLSEKTIIAFTAIESSFRVNASNGSSMGLGQIQLRATEESVSMLNPALNKREVKRLVRTLRSNRSLITDPLINLRLSAEYIKKAIRAAKSNGINPVKISHVYAFYNQGPTGGMNVINGGDPINKRENPKYKAIIQKFKALPWGDFVVDK